MKKFFIALLVLFTFAASNESFAAWKWQWQWVNCSVCHGTGKCLKCKGSGYNQVWKWKTRRDKNGQMQRTRVHVRERCSECYYGQCKKCRGQKQLRVKVKVNVPS